MKIKFTAREVFRYKAFALIYAQRNPVGFFIFFYFFFKNLFLFWMLDALMLFLPKHKLSFVLTNT